MADSITASDIATAALNPQSATADGISATAHSIQDILAAQRAAAAQTALAELAAAGRPGNAWNMCAKSRARPTGSV